MTLVKTTVKFEFKIHGTFEEAQQAIKEQISSDTNEYWQSDDPKAQMTRFEIMDWEIVDEQTR